MTLGPISPPDAVSSAVQSNNVIAEKKESQKVDEEKKTKLNKNQDRKLHEVGKNEKKQKNSKNKDLIDEIL